MSLSVLILGYGSIGRRHAKILKNKFNINNITIFTKQKIAEFKTISSLQEIKKLNPNYIIICSSTSKHFRHLKFVEKNFKNKIVLIEKPIFDKYRKLKIKKNRVYVGYNLRFNPIINYIKKIIYKKKIFDVKIHCGSYLPNWRKNINYKKSSSAQKLLGGGVVLDLSHEIDYARWLFGKIKVKFVKIGKLSNLDIDTEDFLKLYGNIGKANLSVDLNYYSRISKRFVSIDGTNFSIFADLIKYEIEIVKKNYFFNKKFYKSSRDNTYFQQHKAILNGKTENLCDYNFALDTIKIIDKIKKWKKN